MASPSSPATVTTRARSIMTLDGYVSRGHAPPPTVPRDHEMLQDFAAYLELRLKTQNMSILRRIFADFLNEQENTLLPMMQQCVTIVTIFPVLRTNPKRLDLAQTILAKPKAPLDGRGCVFYYLQLRTATRNMAVLKYLFDEFLNRSEGRLLAFAKRGSEVISVIPFELPRAVQQAPVYPSEQATTAVMVKVDEPPRASKRRRKKVVGKLPDLTEMDRARQRSGSITTTISSPENEEEPEHDFAGDSVLVRARPKSAAAAADVVNGAEVALAIVSPKKRGRKRKSDIQGQTKANKRKGNNPMSEATLHRQEDLKKRLQPIEAQSPWKVVFRNVRIPFDEKKYPKLAGRLHAFWRTHARAVWERSFWPPMSHKTDPFHYNARNNRQLTAKNAFEHIIVEAYKQLGPKFFVQLDAKQEPGWWYRGPIVALFALQELKGEAAMMKYVEDNVLLRFPDCKMPLPLKSPNSGAIKNRHTSSSRSMWANYHSIAPIALQEIAAVKAAQQASNPPDKVGSPETIQSVQQEGEPIQASQPEPELSSSEALATSDAPLIVEGAATTPSELAPTPTEKEDAVAQWFPQTVGPEISAADPIHEPSAEVPKASPSRHENAVAILASTQMSNAVVVQSETEKETTATVTAEAVATTIEENKE